MRNGIKILIALILGAVAGGAIWFVWQQKQKDDERQRIEQKAARKAHMDSLMALRNQQVAEEQAALKAQQDQKASMAFLRDFYQSVFFDGWDASVYANNLSERCFEKLTGTDTSSDDDTDGDIDWKQLGPGFETRDDFKKDLPQLIKNFRITHDHDNWYRVRFSARGLTEYRRIEAFPYKGKVIINDFQ